MERPAPFELTKWYLDLVTDGGIAVIAYRASLRWGLLRASYAAVLRSAPGRAVEESVSLRGGAAPKSDGDLLTWTSRPLRFTGSWRRASTPVAATLLDTRHGAIAWECRMPSASARITWRDAEHAGLGYAERLRLTIPPQRLPFRTLHWGRHTSDRHALVWIAWDGETRASWTWLDGVARPKAAVGADGPDPGDGAVLRLEHPRDLRDGTIATVTAPFAARMRHRLSRLMPALSEHKRLSRSSLAAGGGPADEGWTIHETVAW